MRKQKKGITNKYIQTFTKIWVNRLLWFGVTWITCSYILAFIGKESIAEALSQTVAEVIIATILGYLCKAFFENFSQKRNEIYEKKFVHENHEYESEE
jgi:hypothetical protein